MRGASHVASSRLPASWPSLSFTRGMFTFLGVASRRSGERARLASRPSSGGCFGVAALHSKRFAHRRPQFGGNQARGWVGAPVGFRQTAAMRAKVLEMSPPHNMSANTDAQGSLAAPRPFLGRRLPSR